MSIIRVVHNKENPYVQLNKAALWNENLSLDAVGLWARCMSRPDNWKFNIKELVSKCKEGRKTIDNAIHELILNRYALRLEGWTKKENGKFDNKIIEFIFFEFPPSEEEIEAYREEFKKCYRLCPLGNLRAGNLPKEHLLNIEDTKEEKKETKERTSAVAASPLSHFFFEKIKEMKTSRGLSPPKPPNFKEWNQAMDRIIRIDGRDPEKVKSMISWAMCDDFWHTVLLSPKSLRASFDKLEIQMKVDLEKKAFQKVKVQESQIVQANKNTFFEAKRKHPSYFKGIFVKDFGIVHSESGRDVAWNSTQEHFEKVLCAMTGLRPKKENS